MPHSGGINSPMETVDPAPSQGSGQLGSDATCSGGSFQGHKTVPCQELKHGPVPPAGVGAGDDGDLRLKK